MPEPVSSNQEERNIRQQKNSRHGQIDCSVGQHNNCQYPRGISQMPAPPAAVSQSRHYETSRQGGVDNMKASCTKTSCKIPKRYSTNI